MGKVYDAFYYGDHVYASLASLIFHNSKITLQDAYKVCVAKLTLCNVLDCGEKLGTRWTTSRREPIGIVKATNINSSNGVTLVTGDTTYYYTKANDKTSKICDKKPLSPNDKELLLKIITDRNNCDATNEVSSFIYSLLFGLTDETGIEATKTTETTLSIDFVDESLSIKESNKKMEQLLETFYATCRICLQLFGVDVDCSDTERQLKVYHKIKIKATKVGDGQDLYKFVFENKRKQDLQDLQLTLLNPLFNVPCYFIKNNLFQKKIYQEDNPNVVVLKYLREQERELLSDCRHVLILDGTNTGKAVVAYKNIRDIAKLLDNDVEKIAKVLLETESKEN
jgi:hypothetical protein